MILIFYSFVIASLFSDKTSNASFSITGIILLIILGVHGLRAIKEKIAYNFNNTKDEMKGHIKDIINMAKKDAESKDTIDLDKWESEMIKKAENGEIKSFKDLEKYIDASRSKFRIEK